MTFTGPAEWQVLNNWDPAQVQRRVDVVASLTFAGNTIALTVPGHEIWHPLVVRFDITTSATVANRFPRLTYKVQNSTTFPVANGITMAASQNVHLVYWLGNTTQNVETVGATSTNMCFLPDLYLGPGDQLQAVVNQIQAGDTCTLFQVVNDVMFTEPGAPPRPGIYDTDRVAEIEHVLEQATMPGLR